MSPRPTLRQLEVLVAVADAGSFAAAAAALEVDRSSVSRAVAELEALLGGPLFARRPGGASLTAAGRRVVAGARQALALTGGMADEARFAEPHGRVIVGAFRSAASLLLPPIVAELAAARPGVEISITAVREADGGVGDAVLSGACDLGLTSLPTRAGLTTAALTEDPYVMVEPRAGAGDLPFVHWDEDCSRRALEWLAATGRAPERTIRVEDDQVVLALVAAGAGWSLMPAFAARPARPEIRLRRLAGAPHRTIGVCSRPETLARPAVAAVFDGLCASAGRPSRLRPAA